MERKILVVTGDAGESYEAWYAKHRLQEAEYTPVIAAPSKRRLHLVMHDFVGNDQCAQVRSWRPD